MMRNTSLGIFLKIPIFIGGGEEEEGLSHHSNPGLLAPKSGVGGRDREGGWAGTDGCLPGAKTKAL